jgi:glycosyltransferase involved in cell wall biosynthesis
MRVAIVTSIHPDFDSRVWKHARLLAGSGHEVHLVCPWQVKPGEVIDGVTFHPFAKVTSRAARPVLIAARLLPRLFPLLRKVDVVHFHDIDLLPWMTLIALGKPVIYDVHENYAEEMLVRDWIPMPLRKPLSFAVRWSQWAMSMVIRNIVLVAPSQQKDFSSPRLRSTYIYNFASRDLVEGAADDYAARPDTVVFIGSQHVNNGSLLLIEIAALLHKQRPGIKVLAVDRFFNAAFRARFVDEVERQGLRDVLTLTPNVKPHELMSILNRVTIGVSPNLRVPQQINGIHTKVFEYMAAGLPMVISDLPHQVEVMKESRAGILAAPERPQDFVDAIVRLADDREAARRMGQAGREAFFARYCYESQRDKMLDFYRTVLGTPV